MVELLLVLPTEAFFNFLVDTTEKAKEGKRQKKSLRHRAPWSAGHSGSI